MRADLYTIFLLWMSYTPIVNLRSLIITVTVAMIIGERIGRRHRTVQVLPLRADVRGRQSRQAAVRQIIDIFDIFDLSFFGSGARTFVSCCCNGSDRRGRGDAMTVALAFSAVLPSLLLLWYFYSRDKYPEPPKVVAIAFALGVATIPLVLGFGKLVERIIGAGPDDPYLGGAVDAFVYAALPEEALKLAILLAYVRRQSAFDEPMDGLVYGVAVSLGFATLENVVYVSSGNFELALVRALTTLPCHCTLGAIMGFYVARATFDPASAWRSLIAALVVPTLLHTAFDYPLLTIARFEDPAAIPDLIGRGLMGLVFGSLGFMVLWAWGLARRHRSEQHGVAPATPLGERLGHLLFIGVGGLAATCGALLIIGGLDAPGVPLVVGVILVGVGMVVFALAIRRANHLERPNVPSR